MSHFARESFNCCSRVAVDVCNWSKHTSWSQLLAPPCLFLSHQTEETEWTHGFERRTEGNVFFLLLRLFVLLLFNIMFISKLVKMRTHWTPFVPATFLLAHSISLCRCQFTHMKKKAKTQQTSRDRKRGDKMTRTAEKHRNLTRALNGYVPVGNNTHCENDELSKTLKHSITISFYSLVCRSFKANLLEPDANCCHRAWCTSPVRLHNSNSFSKCVALEIIWTENESVLFWSLYRSFAPEPASLWKLNLKILNWVTWDSSISSLFERSTGLFSLQE